MVERLRTRMLLSFRVHSSTFFLLLVAHCSTHRVEFFAWEKVIRTVYKFLTQNDVNGEVASQCESVGGGTQNGREVIYVPTFIKSFKRCGHRFLF